jgi:asparagine synthase (glutamine-hydrolysing)
MLEHGVPYYSGFEKLWLQKSRAFSMQVKNCIIGGTVSGELPAKLAPLLARSDFDYQVTADNPSIFLLARGNHSICRESAKHVFTVAGHICYSGKEAVNLEALKEIERSYLANGHIPIEHLEGSFTIILLDKTERTITIYRNILGLPPIYYSQTQKSAIFSDNLSILAQIHSNLNSRLEVNSKQLPTHLMFGRVSGRETFFKGIFKVMPGEQACFRENNVSLLQLQTFPDVIGPTIDNCVESLEKVMQKIIIEYTRTYPRMGSFFSGGVDSSYIQAHLAQCLSGDLRTYSVDLIHPSWKREHEYAKSGSEFFKSRHTFTRVDPRTYSSLLIEATAMLGQHVCHAQTAFVPTISGAAVRDVPVCLCGMCADTLFGMEIGRHIDISHKIGKLVPWNFSRRMLMQMVEILPKTPLSSNWLQTFQECIELDLENDSSPTHPFNTHQRLNLGLMFDIFGREKVAEAMSQRRAILTRFMITGTLKERVHSLDLVLCTELCERFYQLASCRGLNMIFPYLDSRIVKVTLSMNTDYRLPPMQTKKVLKNALRKYMPNELIDRKKSAWGVPLFEWLGTGGVLSQLVEKINEYPFLEGKMNAVKRTQGWPLWNLLTFDLWHKLFIDRNP